MTTEQAKTHDCEACGFRARAEEKPRSLIGIAWRLHTYVCPGWRSYQRTRAHAPQEQGQQRDAS
jgi:hypothetical protein